MPDSISRWEEEVNGLMRDDLWRQLKLCDEERRRAREAESHAEQAVEAAHETVGPGSKLDSNKRIRITYDQLQEKRTTSSSKELTRPKRVDRAQEWLVHRAVGSVHVGGNLEPCCTHVGDDADALRHLVETGDTKAIAKLVAVDALRHLVKPGDTKAIAKLVAEIAPGGTGVNYGCEHLFHFDWQRLPAFDAPVLEEAGKSEEDLRRELQDSRIASIQSTMGNLRESTAASFAELRESTAVQLDALAARMDDIATQ